MRILKNTKWQLTALKRPLYCTFISLSLLGYLGRKNVISSAWHFTARKCNVRFSARVRQKWRSEEKCEVQSCASLQCTPQRGRKHAPKFQNGGRVERDKTKFVQFNFKYHGKVWLPNDDTSAGRQRNNLVVTMLSVFLIWLFSLHSDSRHSLVYVKQRCRSWSGKLINFSLPVDCYTLLLLPMMVLIDTLIDL